MSAHQYAMAFTIAGQLASSFRSSFQNAQQLMSGASRKMAELNRQAANVSGMMRQKQAVAQAAQAHAQAKQKMQELVAAAQRTGQAVDRDSKEFKQCEAAIKSTGAALDKVRASMQKFGQGSGLSGQSMGALKGQQGQIKAQVAAQAAMMDGREKYEQNTAHLAAVGMYAAEGFRSVIDTGMQFESSMARVGAVSQASSEDLQKLHDQARELGRTTVWSASEAADGMQYLSMAGFKTEQTLAAMPGMLDLASAGAIDLGRAADIASNILTGFKLEADKMGMAGDILTQTFTTSNTTLESLGETMKYVAPVASNLGVSLQQAAGMAGILGNAGIQGSDAGTGLRAVLLRLAKPTSQGAKALKALGVQTLDASGNMRPAGDVLKEIGTAMQKLPTGKAAQLAKALYGENAISSGMVLQAAAASGELEKYTGTLNNQGAAANVAAKQNDTAAGKVKAFKSAMEAFKINAFEALLPVVNGLTTVLTYVVNAFNELDEVCPGISIVIYTVLGAVAALTIAVPICTMVSGAFAAVMGLCSSVGLTFAGVMAILTSPIMLVVAAFAAVAAACYLVYTRWDDVIAFLQGTFVPAWQTAWETVKKVFASVYDWIAEKLENIITMAKNIGKAISNISFGGGGGSGGGSGVPHMADGGIVSKPTLALIGEGRESEAVIPLSKLADMQRGGGISVSFAPVIQMQGGGDAYDQVRRGLADGAENLKRQLEQLQSQQRRLGYA